MREQTEINDLARRHILAASDQLLRKAGVLGVLPTPLEAVAKMAGVAEIIDISQAPPDLQARKPPFWKRLLGAVLISENVIFIDESQAEVRALFTGFHETGHRIIPWHPRSFLLDYEGSLFKATRDKLEAEANLAAAYLIFQGQRFFADALRYQVSLEVPLALSGVHAASRHATIHYYVEHHPDPVAVIIAGQYRREAGLPIWNCIESKAFQQRYGRLAAAFPSGHLAPSDGLGPFVDELATAAMASDGVITSEAVFQDANGDGQRFIAEGYFNHHCLFVFLVPRRVRLLGRRLELRAS